MLFKLALLMWVLSFMVGLFAGPKERIWMAKLALGGFCLLMLGALIKLLKF
jgi:hypothetical protein